MQITVTEFLTATVKHFPDKAAVVDAGGELSFQALLKCATNLAGILSKVGTHRPIAVFLPKSRQMVAAFAGINLSGNFYVPLDTKSPDSRLQAIVEVLSPAAIITDTKLSAKLRGFWNGPVVMTDDYFQTTVDSSCENTILQAEESIVKSGIIDTDPVYSIFTSGSTGTPKGVVVTHRGVIDYIDWAVDTFKIGNESVIGNQAPFYFDNSTLDIYLMMATGATLDIIPESKFVFPATLIDYLNEHKITFVFWVPFVLVSIANFDILSKKKPVTLRDVFFAGEVMPNRQLNYWRKHLPDCRYVNLYGPTEITVDCTYYIVDRKFEDDEPLPIGFPCRNTDIIILKDRKEACKQGETGEICVRGSSLAAGYYNNPEKTADAFIRNPLCKEFPQTIYCTGDLGYFNEYNELIFVGRSDSQIKHKGYRIELGEIETAVLGTDLVKEGCVVYNHNTQQITLIYSGQEEITLAQIRQQTADRIPAYMLPGVLVREKAMRRNANGKIDRAYYNGSVNKNS